jgi:hypothetical protein
MKLCKTALVLTIASTLAMQSAFAQTPIAKKATKPVIIDVELGKGGVLSGYVFNAQGKPSVNEQIQLLQGKRKIAETKTGAKGEYSFKGLRGGTYRVSSKTGTAAYRLWKNGTAPKTAQNTALVVADKVVRGQLLDDIGGVPMLDGVSTLNLITAGTTIGLAIYTLNETQDNGDDLSVLQQQINILTNTPN